MTHLEGSIGGVGVPSQSLDAIPVTGDDGAVQYRSLINALRAHHELAMNYFAEQQRHSAAAPMPLPRDPGEEEGDDDEAPPEKAPRV